MMHLPVTLQARYICLTERMIEYGPNLGLPHTDVFGGGLFALRLKGAEGIARLENALATGKHSPSLTTLRKYAAVFGKKVELHLV